jgi:hypothetical protein
VKLERLKIETSRQANDNNSSNFQRTIITDHQKTVNSPTTISLPINFNPFHQPIASLKLLITIFQTFIDPNNLFLSDVWRRHSSTKAKFLFHMFEFHANYFFVSQLCLVSFNDSILDTFPSPHDSESSQFRELACFNERSLHWAIFRASMSRMKTDKGK